MAAWHERVVGWRERALRWVRAFLADWAVEKPDDPWLVRVVRSLLAVEARDRTFILAGQAFIAVLPLMIVAATVTTSADGASIAEYLIERFELTGEIAETVRALFERSPEVASRISIFSFGLLLFSVNSFGRSARRTLERAWRLPRAGGSRAVLTGSGGLLTWILTVCFVAWIATFLDDPGGTHWFAFGAFVAVVFSGWSLSTHLFLIRRVPVYQILPGAAFATAASLAVSWSTVLWFPALLARDAARYGVIGVSFALVSLLIVLAAVFVGTAVIGAETAVSLEKLRRRRESS